MAVLDIEELRGALGRLLSTAEVQRTRRVNTLTHPPQDPGDDGVRVRFFASGVVQHRLQRGLDGLGGVAAGPVTVFVHPFHDDGSDISALRVFLDLALEAVKVEDGDDLASRAVVCAEALIALHGGMGGFLSGIVSKMERNAARQTAEFARKRLNEYQDTIRLVLAEAGFRYDADGHEPALVYAEDVPVILRDLLANVGWVSVSEVVPAKGQFLVIRESGGMRVTSIATYRPDPSEWYCIGARAVVDNVTHWRPLPAEPVGE